ncbi:MAG: phosphotransferase [Actinobacteria bacterium]|nr:phosphotransferase [Actinomycetota bacterium]
MEWDATGTDGRLRAWCVEQLGSPPVEEFFSATSMSSVRGVVLADGRRVALKLRNASDRVLACAQAHRHARDAGIDCPELVAGPTQFDNLWLSAEEWRPDGVPDLPPDAAARYATLLRSLVVALAGFEPGLFDPPPPWANYDHTDAGRVWPAPESPHWDPETPRVPAELRRLAAAARERLVAEDLPLVVGHSDLNGLNVRWGPGPIVHDWDSLAGRPESVLAGILAVNHVELPGAGAITTVAGTAETLDRYQELRPFTATEVEVAWAAGVWVAAYNAAFEHLHGAPGAVCRQLEADGEQRLRLAGCGRAGGFTPSTPVR